METGLRETKIRRGGVDKTHYTGKGPEGNSRFYRRTDSPTEKGLVERTYPDYIKIVFDKKGKKLTDCTEGERPGPVGAILHLEVVFEKAPEWPNGEVQTEMAKPIRFFSEWTDLVDFVDRYFGIQLHTMNGLETAGEGFYGLKVFTPTGADADADYTQEQKDAPPSKLHKGYHGIPGTNGPVEPEPEPEPTPGP